MSAKLGVLALQGDFEAHRQKLIELGASVLLVKTAATLQAVSGLILPGGESSAMLRLMDADLRTALTTRIEAGLPVLATCAGTILLASSVSNPNQLSFGMLDIEIERNGYGRQIDSFIANGITLTAEGRKLLGFEERSTATVEGVFIRAPVIRKVGAEVTILATAGNNPVLVRQRNIIAATFHPELGNNTSVLHRAFLDSIN